MQYGSVSSSATPNVLPISQPGFSSNAGSTGSGSVDNTTKRTVEVHAGSSTCNQPVTRPDLHNITHGESDTEYDSYSEDDDYTSPTQTSYHLPARASPDNVTSGTPNKQGNLRSNSNTRVWNKPTTKKNPHANHPVTITDDESSTYAYSENEESDIDSEDSTPGDSKEERKPNSTSKTNTTTTTSSSTSTSEQRHPSSTTPIYISKPNSARNTRLVVGQKHPSKSHTHPDKPTASSPTSTHSSTFSTLPSAHDNKYFQIARVLFSIVVVLLVLYLVWWILENVFHVDITNWMNISDKETGEATSSSDNRSFLGEFDPTLPNTTSLDGSPVLPSIPTSETSHTSSPSLFDRMKTFFGSVAGVPNSSESNLSENMFPPLSEQEVPRVGTLSIQGKGSSSSVDLQQQPLNDKTANDLLELMIRMK